MSKTMRAKAGLDIRNAGEEGFVRLFNLCSLSRFQDLTLVVKCIVLIDAVILRGGFTSALCEASF
jgi:hypothetical protein